MDRRQFVISSSGMIAALAPFAHLSVRAAATSPRKRVAFLGTEVRQHSHAQHFLDRLTQGYIWGGKWVPPQVDVASVFIDQFPEGDLAKQRIQKHHLAQYPTIAEALTLGGSKLAVDGVVIIAEHGDYPRNEMGQTLYPRYQWFKQVVKVFEESGRGVPVFNDKHLSTNWNECREMVDDSHRLGFAFLAGSSLPVTWRLPALELPMDVDLRESVCMAYGGVDSYDFHALETAQCMSERRRGGETGIRQVHAAKGDTLWSLLEKDDRQRTRDLMVAALCRSHNLPVEGGYPTAPVSYAWLKATLPDTTGYLIEHRDGFRTSIFMTGIRDFNYAGYRADTDEIVTCQMYLPMPGHGSTTADFFNPLTRHIEATMINNQASYPVERTLLTSGMVIGGVESLHQGMIARATPEMAVQYAATPASHFWRD